MVLSTLSGAGDYGSMAWDVYAAVNPFLGGMQIDTKRSSGTLYGLLARGLSSWNRGKSAGRGKSAAGDDYETAVPVASGVSTSFDDGYLPSNFYNEYQRGLR